MTSKPVKNRLDLELVQRGLVPSREKAKAMVMAGDVLVDGQVAYKADKPVTEANNIEIKEKFPYASRGGLKIEKAFQDFNIDLKGVKALDVGISTGGFTDYMLKQGAIFVAGVDVNIQQVDYHLQQDKRVKLIKANARNLIPEQVGFEPDVISIDVSFISITLILPALAAFKNATIVSLVKPQFEADRKKVGKGGVIRDTERQAEIVIELKHRIEELNYGIMGFTFAGVKGRKGNQEFFFLLRYGKPSSINDKIITDAIEL